MKKYVFESLKFFCAAILCVILSAFTTPSRAALPSGYTQLEYIESTGTQWIDTGIMPTAKLKIESRVGIITDNASIFGSGTTSENRTQLYTYQQKINLRAWSSENKAIIPYTAGEVYIITVDFLNKKLTLNDTSVDFTYDVNSAINYPIYINEINLAGSANRTAGKQAYYSFKMWENNTLVRDLIPAKRNSDGVIGMYDTVNNRFYTNAGSGEFIAGPDACDGTMVNYTSATGTVSQSGTPTPTNPIYPTFYTQGDMVLRKVGDYADTYDATTGKITRRVGVKVFDGTEDWGYNSSTHVLALQIRYNNFMITHFTKGGTLASNWGNCYSSNGYLGLSNANDVMTSLDQFKQWLASQYAAGTPVTVWYPLAEETTEDWTETSYCSSPIKIATTKYNESAFSPLNTALQNAISVVDTVVSNTITQAGRIATLQAQKQTRPNDIADDNEKCPAGKKCLLVEDASGIPHWYEIVTGRLPDGYTELQYIESTGTQWIDTGVVGKSIVGIEYDFTILNDITVGSSLFGTRLYGNIGSGINFGHSADGKITVDFFDGYRYISNLSFEKNTPYRLVVQNNKYTLYNAITGATLDSHTFNATTSDLEYVAVLFGLNNGGSISAAKDSVKVTSCKIYTTNGIVDLVPALNPDGKIGMYDLVGGRFYENAGTGEFIAGNPVVE